ALHRLDARDPGAGGPGLDLFRVADFLRADHAAIFRGVDWLDRPPRGIRGRDRARRGRVGASRADPRIARARHVARADRAPYRAAAGDRAYAARVRLAA